MLVDEDTVIPVPKVMPPENVVCPKTTVPVYPVKSTFPMTRNEALPVRFKPSLPAETLKLPGILPPPEPPVLIVRVPVLPE